MEQTRFPIDAPSAIRQDGTLSTRNHESPAHISTANGHNRIPSTVTLNNSSIGGNGSSDNNSNLDDVAHKPSRDNCDRRRHDELEHASRLPNMSQQLIGQTVTPFLKEHIPGIYAPIGKPDASSVVSKARDPNSKFCYRHRPDSKCRRAADVNKMAFIQSELERLPSADQQAITHVWSLFSAAPTKHRNLMLQGIITQCCFPQLSTVSREVHEQLKIDFLSALPTELSFQILGHLDCASLCRAAQVSRRWRSLADDDAVWHRMCEQHIDRKCKACGWALPRLEKKRLKDWKRRHLQESQNDRPGPQRLLTMDDNSTTPVLGKRGASGSEEEAPSKRQCVDSVVEQNRDLQRKFRPWKDVYRDRYKVGSNWKYGRCSIKTFRGQHGNGITCLQFDDNILATGSYDASIKLWDIRSGEVIRTLQGHSMGIRALQFDERVLVSGSLDHTVKIWNWRTGVCINTLSHQEGVISVHMDGDFLASGSMDKTIKIFNFKTQQTYCLRGHTDYVNQVRVDIASRTVLSASDDCTVKLWDLDSKTCIKTYEGHVGQVQQVLPLPDDFEFEEEGVHEADAVSVTSNRSDTPTVSVASSSSACHEHIVDDERASYGPIFQEHSSRELPPRYMLTGSLDATIRLWDTATGKCLKTFFGHLEGIWSLVGDTLRVVTGANDAMVKIWEPRTGKCERTFGGHVGPVTCVGLSDSRMASGGEDGEVRLYSFEGEPHEVEEWGTPA